jgi:ABC-type anion transport system duplicated permease subunit
MSEPVKGKNGTIQKLLVPLVLIVGLLVGELISYVSAVPEDKRGDPFRHFPEHFTDPLFGLHIVFTTIEVALLISLLVIYLRTYAETRARFALGLVVVLGAFLVQALLSYPLVAGLLGPVNMGPGLSSQISDVVTICAYTIFLYLSLG